MASREHNLGRQASSARYSASWAEPEIQKFYVMRRKISMSVDF